MKALVDFAALIADELGTILWSGRGRQRLRRGLMLLVWLGFFGPWITWTWVCLALDRLLFPGVLATKLEQPFFILGNHRTGSTFLHRLLSEDTGTFGTARLWDLIFPALVQKRGLRFLGRLDATIGRPLGRLVDWLDARWATDYRQVHPMGIQLAEEDEFWLLHCFKSSAIWEIHPRVDRFRRLFWVDAEMPQAEADWVMAFYRAMAQRCFAFHGGGTWMSKNPLFTSKAATLRRAFPDARFLVLVRDPAKVVPSTASLIHFPQRDLGALAADEVHMDPIHEICKRFYTEPLEALDGLPPERLAVLRYEDLRADLPGAIEATFGQLGLPFTPELQAAIATSLATPYTRTHAYSPDDWGLSEAVMAEHYGGIKARWGY